MTDVLQASKGTVSFIFAIIFFALCEAFLFLYFHRVGGFFTNLFLSYLVLPRDTVWFHVGSLQLHPLRMRLFFTDLQYDTANSSVRVLDGYVTFTFWRRARGEGTQWTEVTPSMVYSDQLCGKPCLVRVGAEWLNGWIAVVLRSSSHPPQNYSSTDNNSRGTAPKIDNKAHLLVKLSPDAHRKLLDNMINLKAYSPSMLLRLCCTCGGCCQAKNDQKHKDCTKDCLNVPLRDVQVQRNKGLLSVHLNGVDVSIYNNINKYKELKETLMKISEQNAQNSWRRHSKDPQASLKTKRSISNPLLYKSEFNNGHNRRKSCDSGLNTSMRVPKPGTISSPDTDDKRAENDPDGSEVGHNSVKVTIGKKINHIWKQVKASFSLFERFLRFINCVEFQVYSGAISVGSCEQSNDAYPYFIYMGFKRADGRFFVTRDGVSRVDKGRNVIDVTFERAECHLNHRNFDNRRRTDVKQKRIGICDFLLSCCGRRSKAQAKNSHDFRPSCGDDAAGDSFNEGRGRRRWGDGVLRSAMLILHGDTGGGVSPVRNRTEVGTEFASRFGVTSPRSTGKGIDDKSWQDSGVAKTFGVILDPRSEANIQVKYYWDLPGEVYMDREDINDYCDILFNPKIEKIVPFVEEIKNLPIMGMEVYIDTDEITYGSFVENARQQLWRHFFPPDYRPLQYLGEAVSALENSSGKLLLPRPYGDFEFQLSLTRRTRLVMPFKIKTATPNPPYGLRDSGRIGSILSTMEAGSSMILRAPSGFFDANDRKTTTNIFFNLINPDIRTSITGNSLLRAMNIDVFFDITNAEFWNRTVLMDVILRMRGASCFYLSDSIGFLTDFITDWTNVPTLYYGKPLDEKHFAESYSNSFIPTITRFEVFCDPPTEQDRHIWEIFRTQHQPLTYFGLNPTETFQKENDNGEVSDDAGSDAGGQHKTEEGNSVVKIPEGNAEDGLSSVMAPKVKEKELEMHEKKTQSIFSKEEAQKKNEKRESRRGSLTRGVIKNVTPSLILSERDYGNDDDPFFHTPCCGLVLYLNTNKHNIVYAGDATSILDNNFLVLAVRTAGIRVNIPLDTVRLQEINPVVTDFDVKISNIELFSSFSTGHQAHGLWPVHVPFARVFNCHVFGDLIQELPPLITRPLSSFDNGSTLDVPKPGCMRHSETENSMNGDLKKTQTVHGWVSSSLNFLTGLFSKKKSEFPVQNDQKHSNSLVMHDSSFLVDRSHISLKNNSLRRGVEKDGKVLSEDSDDIPLNIINATASNTLNQAPKGSVKSDGSENTGENNFQQEFVASLENVQHDSDMPRELEKDNLVSPVQSWIRTANSTNDLGNISSAFGAEYQNGATHDDRRSDTYGNMRSQTILTDHLNLNINIGDTHATVTPPIIVAFYQLLDNLFIDDPGTIEPSDAFFIAEFLSGTESRCNLRRHYDAFLCQDDTSLRQMDVMLKMKISDPHVALTTSFDPIVHSHVIPVMITDAELGLQKKTQWSNNAQIPADTVDLDAARAGDNTTPASSFWSCFVHSRDQSAEYTTVSLQTSLCMDKGADGNTTLAPVAITYVVVPQSYYLFAHTSELRLSMLLTTERSTLNLSVRPVALRLPHINAVVNKLFQKQLNEEIRESCLFTDGVTKKKTEQNSTPENDARDSSPEIVVKPDPEEMECVIPIEGDVRLSRKLNRGNFRQRQMWNGYGGSGQISNFEINSNGAANVNDRSAVRSGWGQNRSLPANSPPITQLTCLVAGKVDYMDPQALQKIPVRCAEDGNGWEFYIEIDHYLSDEEFIVISNLELDRGREISAPPESQCFYGPLKLSIDGISSHLESVDVVSYLALMGEEMSAQLAFEDTHLTRAIQRAVRANINETACRSEWEALLNDYNLLISMGVCNINTPHVPAAATVTAAAVYNNVGWVNFRSNSKDRGSGQKQSIFSQVLGSYVSSLARNSKTRKPGSTRNKTSSNARRNSMPFIAAGGMSVTSRSSSVRRKSKKTYKWSLSKKREERAPQRQTATLPEAAKEFVIIGGMLQNEKRSELLCDSVNERLQALGRRPRIIAADRDILNLGWIKSIALYRGLGVGWARSEKLEFAAYAQLRESELNASREMGVFLTRLDIAAISVTIRITPVISHKRVLAVNGNIPLAKVIEGPGSDFDKQTLSSDAFFQLNLSNGIQYANSSQDDGNSSSRCTAIVSSVVMRIVAARAKESPESAKSPQDRIPRMAFEKSDAQEQQLNSTEPTSSHSNFREISVCETGVNMRCYTMKPRQTAQTTRNASQRDYIRTRDRRGIVRFDTAEQDEIEAIRNHATTTGQHIGLTCSATARRMWSAERSSRSSSSKPAPSATPAPQSNSASTSITNELDPTNIQSKTGHEADKHNAMDASQGDSRRSSSLQMFLSSLISADSNTGVESTGRQKRGTDTLKHSSSHGLLTHNLCASTDERPEPEEIDVGSKNGGAEIQERQQRETSQKRQSQESDQKSEKSVISDGENNDVSAAVVKRNEPSGVTGFVQSLESTSETETSDGTKSDDKLPVQRTKSPNHSIVEKNKKSPNFIKHDSLVTPVRIAADFKPFNSDKFANKKDENNCEEPSNRRNNTSEGRNESSTGFDEEEEDDDEQNGHEDTNDYLQFIRNIGIAAEADEPVERKVKVSKHRDGRQRKYGAGAEKFRDAVRLMSKTSFHRQSAVWEEPNLTSETVINSIFRPVDVIYGYESAPHKLPLGVKYEWFTLPDNSSMKNFIGIHSPFPATAFPTRTQNAAECLPRLFGFDCPYIAHDVNPTAFAATTIENSRRAKQGILTTHVNAHLNPNTRVLISDEAVYLLSVAAQVLLRVGKQLKEQRIERELWCTEPDMREHPDVSIPTARSRNDSITNSNSALFASGGGSRLPRSARNSGGMNMSEVHNIIRKAAFASMNKIKAERNRRGNQKLNPATDTIFSFFIPRIEAKMLLITKELKKENSTWAGSFSHANADSQHRLSRDTPHYPTRNRAGSTVAFWRVPGASTHNPTVERVVSNPSVKTPGIIKELYCMTFVGKEISLVFRRSATAIKSWRGEFDAEIDHFKTMVWSVRSGLIATYAQLLHSERAATTLEKWEQDVRDAQQYGITLPIPLHTISSKFPVIGVQFITEVSFRGRFETQARSLGAASRICFRTAEVHLGSSMVGAIAGLSQLVRRTAKNNAAFTQRLPQKEDTSVPTMQRTSGNSNWWGEVSESGRVPGLQRYCQQEGVTGTARRRISGHIQGKIEGKSLRVTLWGTDQALIGSPPSTAKLRSIRSMARMNRSYSSSQQSRPHQLLYILKGSGPMAHFTCRLRDAEFSENVVAFSILTELRNQSAWIWPSIAGFINNVSHRMKEISDTIEVLTLKDANDLPQASQPAPSDSVKIIYTISFSSPNVHIAIMSPDSNANYAALRTSGFVLHAANAPVVPRNAGPEGGRMDYEGFSNVSVHSSMYEDPDGERGPKYPEFLAVDSRQEMQTCVTLFYNRLDLNYFADTGKLTKKQQKMASRDKDTLEKMCARSLSSTKTTTHATVKKYVLPSAGTKSCGDKLHNEYCTLCDAEDFIDDEPVEYRDQEVARATKVAGTKMMYFDVNDFTAAVHITNTPSGTPQLAFNVGTKRIGAHAPLRLYLFDIVYPQIVSFLRFWNTAFTDALRSVDECPVVPSTRPSVSMQNVNSDVVKHESGSVVNTADRGNTDRLSNLNSAVNSPRVIEQNSEGLMANSVPQGLTIIGSVSLHEIHLVVCLPQGDEMRVYFPHIDTVGFFCPANKKFDTKLNIFSGNILTTDRANKKRSLALPQAFLLAAGDQEIRNIVFAMDRLEAILTPSFIAHIAIFYELFTKELLTAFQTTEFSPDGGQQSGDCGNPLRRMGGGSPRDGDGATFATPRNAISSSAVDLTGPRVNPMTRISASWSGARITVSTASCASTFSVDGVTVLGTVSKPLDGEGDEHSMLYTVENTEGVPRMYTHSIWGNDLPPMRVLAMSDDRTDISDDSTVNSETALQKIAGDANFRGAIAKLSFCIADREDMDRRRIFYEAQSKYFACRGEGSGEVPTQAPHADMLNATREFLKGSVEIPAAARVSFTGSAQSKQDSNSLQDTTVDESGHGYGGYLPSCGYMWLHLSSSLETKVGTIHTRTRGDSNYGGAQSPGSTYCEHPGGSTSMGTPFGPSAGTNRAGWMYRRRLSLVNPAEEQGAEGSFGGLSRMQSTQKLRPPRASSHDSSLSDLSSDKDMSSAAEEYVLVSKSTNVSFNVEWLHAFARFGVVQQLEMIQREFELVFMNKRLSAKRLSKQRKLLVNSREYKKLIRKLNKIEKYSFPPRNERATRPRTAEASLGRNSYMERTPIVSRDGNEAGMDTSGKMNPLILQGSINNLLAAMPFGDAAYATLLRAAREDEENVGTSGFRNKYLSLLQEPSGRNGEGMNTWSLSKLNRSAFVSACVAKFSIREMHILADYSTPKDPAVFTAFREVSEAAAAHPSMREASITTNTTASGGDIYGRRRRPHRAESQPQHMQKRRTIYVSDPKDILPSMIKGLGGARESGHSPVISGFATGNSDVATESNESRILSLMQRRNSRQLTVSVVVLNVNAYITTGQRLSSIAPAALQQLLLSNVLLGGKGVLYLGMQVPNVRLPRRLKNVLLTFVSSDTAVSVQGAQVFNELPSVGHTGRDRTHSPKPTISAEYLSRSGQKDAIMQALSSSYLPCVARSEIKKSYILYIDKEINEAKNKLSIAHILAPIRAAVDMREQLTRVNLNLLVSPLCGELSTRLALFMSAIRREFSSDVLCDEALVRTRRGGKCSGGQTGNFFIGKPAGDVSISIGSGLDDGASTTDMTSVVQTASDDEKSVGIDPEVMSHLGGLLNYMRAINVEVHVALNLEAGSINMHHMRQARTYETPTSPGLTPWTKPSSPGNNRNREDTTIQSDSSVGGFGSPSRQRRHLGGKGRRTRSTSSGENSQQKTDSNYELFMKLPTPEISVRSLYTKSPVEESVNVSFECEWDPIDVFMPVVSFFGEVDGWHEQFQLLKSNSDKILRLVEAIPPNSGSQVAEFTALINKYLPHTVVVDALLPIPRCFISRVAEHARIGCTAAASKWASGEDRTGTRLRSPRKEGIPFLKDLNQSAGARLHASATGVNNASMTDSAWGRQVADSTDGSVRKFSVKTRTLILRVCISKCKIMFSAAPFAPTTLSLSMGGSDALTVLLQIRLLSSVDAMERHISFVEGMGDGTTVGSASQGPERDRNAATLAPVMDSSFGPRTVSVGYCGEESPSHEASVADTSVRSLTLTRSMAPTGGSRMEFALLVFVKELRVECFKKMEMPSLIASIGGIRFNVTQARGHRCIALQVLSHHSMEQEPFQGDAGIGRCSSDVYTSQQTDTKITGVESASDRGKSSASAGIDVLFRLGNSSQVFNIIQLLVVKYCDLMRGINHMKELSGYSALAVPEVWSGGNTIPKDNGNASRARDWRAVRNKIVESINTTPLDEHINQTTVLISVDLTTVYVDLGVSNKHELKLGVIGCRLFVDDLDPIYGSVLRDFTFSLASLNLISDGSLTGSVALNSGVQFRYSRVKNGEQCKRPELSGNYNDLWASRSRLSTSSLDAGNNSLPLQPLFLTPQGRTRMCSLWVSSLRIQYKERQIKDIVWSHINAFRLTIKDSALQRSALVDIAASKFVVGITVEVVGAVSHVNKTSLEAIVDQRAEAYAALMNANIDLDAEEAKFVPAAVIRRFFPPLNLPTASGVSMKSSGADVADNASSASSAPGNTLGPQDSGSGSSLTGKREESPPRTAIANANELHPLQLTVQIRDVTLMFGNISLLQLVHTTSSASPGFYVVVPVFNLTYAQAFTPQTNIQKVFFETGVSSWEVRRTDDRRSSVVRCEGKNTMRLFLENHIGENEVGYVFKYIQQVPWTDLPDISDIVAAKSIIDSFRRATSSRLSDVQQMPLPMQNVKESSTAGVATVLHSKAAQLNVRVPGGKAAPPAVHNVTYKPLKQSFFAPQVSDISFNIDKILSVVGLSANTVPVCISEKVCMPLGKSLSLLAEKVVDKSIDLE